MTSSESSDPDAARYEADPERMLQPSGPGFRPPWRRFSRPVTITNPPCDQDSVLRAMRRQVRLSGSSA